MLQNPRGIVRLDDPTVFTITSPSSWQKSKDRDPVAPEIPVWRPMPPVQIVKGEEPETEMQPPQLSMLEVLDSMVASLTPVKLFLQEFPEITFPLFQPSAESD